MQLFINEVIIDLWFFDKIKTYIYLYNTDTDFWNFNFIVGETIRADDSSRFRDQITELSSKIMIATTETIDVSKTLDKILPIENIEVKEFEEQTKEKKESETVLISEIISFEEKIR